MLVRSWVGERQLIQEYKYVLGAIAFQFTCYVNISRSQMVTHLSVNSSNAFYCLTRNLLKSRTQTSQLTAIFFFLKMQHLLVWIDQQPPTEQDDRTSAQWSCSLWSHFEGSFERFTFQMETDLTQSNSHGFYTAFPTSSTLIAFTAKVQLFLKLKQASTSIKVEKHCSEQHSCWWHQKDFY